MRPRMCSIFSPAEALAHVAVAAEAAGAGHDEVADPAQPAKVSGGAQRAAQRVISARPRVISAALVLSRTRSVADAGARAMTF